MAAKSEYRLGAKRFLGSIEAGQQIVYNGEYRWKSLQTLAARMSQDYGVKFIFRTSHDKVRTIIRTR